MAIQSGITISGMDEVLKNLRAYGQNTREAAGQALYEEASTIKAASQARYVPVDWGELRRDHAFIDESAKIEGDRVSITFGYSGPYAASVHENPRAGKTGGVSPSGRKYAHWASVGEWKYLEKPLLEAESGMLQRLAGRIRNALGGKLAATFYGG
jgi:hypothetical protein